MALTNKWSNNYLIQNDTFIVFSREFIEILELNLRFFNFLPSKIPIEDINRQNGGKNIDFQNQNIAEKLGSDQIKSFNYNFIVTY